MSTPRHLLEALCPIVEGSLVRYLLRMGESARTAQRILRAWHADPRVGFVGDDLSYTDAYLVALAQRHHLTLPTLDAPMAKVHPLAMLLPEVCAVRAVPGGGVADS